MRALRDLAATLGDEDMPVRTALIVSFLLLLTVTGCATAPDASAPGAGARAGWAIAIHGGAGTMNPNAPKERLQAYRDAMTAALTLGRDLANGPQVAYAYIKDNLDEALSIDHATAIDREADRLLKARTTADHREAVRAFAEKRSPRFTGR